MKHHNYNSLCIIKEKGYKSLRSSKDCSSRRALCRRVRLVCLRALTSSNRLPSVAYSRSSSATSALSLRRSASQSHCIWSSLLRGGVAASSGRRFWREDSEREEYSNVYTNKLMKNKMAFEQYFLIFYLPLSVGDAGASTNATYSISRSTVGGLEPINVNG